MKPQTPSVAQMRLALNKQGMYSPLEKVAMAVPRTKGTPAEFMAEISKQPGFRKDEVEDRKISLPEQKMTKDEFLAHVQQNHPMPLIEEKVHREVPFDEYQRLTDEFSQEMFGDDYHMLSSKEQRQVRDRLEAMPQADHEQWTLPGGENYREVLLKKPGFTGQDAIMQIEASLRRTDDPQVQAGLMKRLTELKKQQEQHGDIFPGNPNHFNGEPGIIASLRLKDRTGPNGEKILHVEEVQSDWHQKGRKEGYKQTGLFSAFRNGVPVGSPSTDPAEIQGWKNAGYDVGPVEDETIGAVPDAPFKKNWHELALKHALGIAAKGGYHGIAITPGEQQADRYDLSQHIDELHYNPDLGTLVGNRDRQGKLYKRGVTPDKLESYVGKEVAAKIMAQEPNEGGMRSLVGQQLTVGGEGMKGFYDKIVPTFLNKFGKPHGAQVAMNAVPVVTKTMKMRDPQTMQPYERPIAQADLHYFPITDTLRQQIKTEGLPQYDHGGTVHDLDHFFQSDDRLEHFFQE